MYSLRRVFGKRHVGDVFPIPPLLSIQLDSYRHFLEQGLQFELKSFFPVLGKIKEIRLEYVSHYLEPPSFSVEECYAQYLTYSATLQAQLRLYKDGKVIGESEVALCNLPLMTDTGHFVISGISRVIVSQMRRSPGIFFSYDEKKTQFVAQVIPAFGTWLECEFDVKRERVFFRIDKKRKLPIPIIFKALGYSEDEVLERFYVKTSFNDLRHFEPKKPVLFRLRSKEKKTRYQLYNPVAFAQEVENWNSQHAILDVLSLRDDAKDFYIFYSFLEDSSATDSVEMECQKEMEEAILAIYQAIQRNIPEKNLIKEGFHRIFFDPNYYGLSPIGRTRLSQRLYDSDREDLEAAVLYKDDFFEMVNRLIAIYSLKPPEKQWVDDVDHLKNKCLYRVGDIIELQFRSGLVRLRRSISNELEKLRTYTSTAKYDPKNLINSKLVSSFLHEFFNSSPFSQFMEQVNPLSEVSHLRKVSFLGNGLSREHAGFEVRDVQSSYYALLCVIETPEGSNIGLINSLAIYANVDDHGFLTAPYYEIAQDKTIKGIKYFSATDEDREDCVIAPYNFIFDKGEWVTCRHKGEFVLKNKSEVKYMDVSPDQIVSISAALIPFLEHNDAKRVLMGCNMQRQAVPLLFAHPPLIGTGIERRIAMDSRVLLTAKRAGVVEHADSLRVIIRTTEDVQQDFVDIYNLVELQRTNGKTCRFHRLLVKNGDVVNRGDVLADDASTFQSDLALGANLLVAFMSWYGYGFEDAVVISDRVVKSDALTSVHIEEFTCEVKETKLGSEQTTSDIPNVNSDILSKLDDSGIVYIGQHVKPGDILVGKVSPTRASTSISPEEKLVRAVFGDKAKEVRDTSLCVPLNIEGVVTHVSIFTADKTSKDQRVIEIEDGLKQKIYKDLEDELKIERRMIIEALRSNLVGKEAHTGDEILVLNRHYLDSLLEKALLELSLSDQDSMIEDCHLALQQTEERIKEKYSKKIEKVGKYGNLSPGVIKVVKVFVSFKRRIQVGDKISGRYGNKSVISAIIPSVDMPYTEDGRPVDVIFNTLGVPSRMNMGQVLEVHLGLASWGIGEKIATLMKTDVEQLRDYLCEIYDNSLQSVDLKTASHSQLLDIAQRLQHGLPVATPVFNGASGEDIKKMLRLSGFPDNGQIKLYDGYTSKLFDREVTVGFMYILKLNHMVKDKVHSRSTGTYGLITQQPLGGRSQCGGQRTGEMEMWALEAYGAAYTLQEMLTVKSDDVHGRNAMYYNIAKLGKAKMQTGLPESFVVLVKELQALGISIDFQNIQGKNNYEPDN